MVKGKKQDGAYTKKIACITSQMLPEGVVYLNLLIHGLNFLVVCSVHHRTIVPTERKEKKNENGECICRVSVRVINTEGNKDVQFLGDL